MADGYFSHLYIKIYSSSVRLYLTVLLIKSLSFIFVSWQVIHSKSYIRSGGIMARKSVTAERKGWSVTRWSKGLWELISWICRSTEDRTVPDTRAPAIATSIWISKYHSKWYAPKLLCYGVHWKATCRWGVTQLAGNVCQDLFCHDIGHLRINH